MKICVQQSGPETSMTKTRKQFADEQPAFHSIR